MGAHFALRAVGEWALYAETFGDYHTQRGLCNNQKLGEVEMKSCAMYIKMYCYSGLMKVPSEAVL